MMICPRITKLYMYKPPKDYTLDILREECLWAAKPKHFNDPFDCDLEITKGITAKDYLAAMRHKRYSQREIDKYVTADGNFTLEGQERTDKAMQKLIKDQRNMGILCLSEEWDSIRMWSHYAKDHKGVCLEFTRAEGNCLGNEYMCSPVNYVSHYPQIDLGQMLLNSDGRTIARIMKTKSADWSYEKEWRLITLLGDQKCPWPGPISRVILGIKIEDEFKANIEKLCKARNIPCVQARKANRKFRIEVP